jgi:hypothetical protein
MSWHCVTFTTADIVGKRHMDLQDDDGWPPDRHATRHSSPPTSTERDEVRTTSRPARCCSPTRSYPRIEARRPVHRLPAPHSWSATTTFGKNWSDRGGEDRDPGHLSDARGMGPDRGAVARTDEADRAKRQAVTRGYRPEPPGVIR